MTFEKQEGRMRTMLVTTVEVEPGLTIAATWNGGPAIHLHVVRNGATIRVAFWSIWNPVWDAPLIEPTIDSFETLIAGRLDEPGVVDELVGMAAA
jgi:hypothetical protein